MTTTSPRWPYPTEVEEVAHRVATEGVLVHAAVSGADDQTLCEHDGPTLLGDDNVRLNLDGPDAAKYRHTVTCPDCLEWMHA